MTPLGILVLKIAFKIKQNFLKIQKSEMSKKKWLFAHLLHIKCIRLGSLRSRHLPI